MCVCVNMNSEEHTKFPGAGIIGRCDPLVVGTGT